MTSNLIPKGEAVVITTPYRSSWVSLYDGRKTVKRFEVMACSLTAIVAESVFLGDSPI